MAHHVRIGQAVHRQEKEAIDFLVRNLPKHYYVYSNVELATGRPGQTFEHDAIVVAPHAVYTVEIKSWGGTIRGTRDRWTLADGVMWHSPIPPTQSKARVLKGRLKARRADLSRVWVQGLIFLSAADADPHISADYADLVTTRRDVIKALTDPGWFHIRGVMRPGQIRAVESVLADGHPRRHDNRLGKFELLEKLDAEGRPYEAWVGKEPLGGNRHILHVHTIAADDRDARESIRKHALREATLHQRLRGGPNILRYDAYDLLMEDDPQRIVLQFEDTTPLQPLPGWVEEHLPGLGTRLQIAAKLTEAVAWVHARKIALRGLTPDVVLVSPEENPALVRLCAFDLARDTSAGSTTRIGSAGVTELRTSAPEVLKSGIADEVSDLFSLGASLYELFAGRPLFDSVDAILQPFEVPPVDVGGRRLPAEVHGLLVRLLDPQGTQRPKAEEALEILREAARAQTLRRFDAPLEVGSVVRDNFELEQRLGRGATATTWRARHLQTQQVRVLKIGAAENAELLALECRILTDLQHKNLVRAYDVGPDGDWQVLVLESVDGFTGRLQVEAGDPTIPETFRRAFRGLLRAVQALHEAGWLHRDIKPENLIFRDEGLEPVLLDLGLACPLDQEGDLTVGTPLYKDPLVYQEGRWTPANDIYAAYLVLAELLTGAHPFGGSSPDDQRSPEIAPEEVSDTFGEEVTRALVEALRAGLSPAREDRPKDALDALKALENALGGAQGGEVLDATAEVLAEWAVEPGTSVRELDLSKRALGALARLQIRTAAQLAGLDPRAARRLSNVGAKTQRELRRWSEGLRALWPDVAPVAAAPEPELYPSLRRDDRPISDLGSALSAHFQEQFRARNIRTIGHLAATTEATLLAIPRFGRRKLDALRDAMARLADNEAPPPLKVLDARLREELGASKHDYLASLAGLHDGQPRGVSEVAALFGVTRQRVDQAVDLEPLRAPASEVASLLRLVRDILPPAGIAPLDFVAAALAERLGEEPGVSARGYAVLAALLLDAERRAAHAPDITRVLRSPWTAELLDQALDRLAEATRWPYRRERAEQEAWDGLPEAVQVALVRRGCDASQLLGALLRLSPEIRVDPYGALYLPPLPLADVLREHRGDLLPQAAPVEAERIAEVVQQTWSGVALPEDIERALTAAGWGQEGGRWYDPERYQPAERPAAPVVDPEVPREQVSEARVPPVVRALVAAAQVGGVRVVTMPPGRAHAWTDQLVTWLRAALGAARPVRRVHLDRLILQALKDEDLWRYVPYQEKVPEQDQDWSWVHEPVEAALERELSQLQRGEVTVLGDPALLGTLGLMHWLSGFYERARGGRHGLLVLAMPGGVHDNRVRLNERYNLPYTPDMSAVYLDEVTR